MLGPEKIKEICDFLLQRCQPAQAEVWVELFHESLTRFAANTIHQNVAESNATVTLRVSLEQRSGLASTNQLDNSALEALAADALSHALLSPADPLEPGLGEAQPIPSARAFDEACAACIPAQRAAAVAPICHQAAERGLEAAGAYSTAAIEWAAANSNGVFAYHPHTCAELQVSVLGPDSSGRAQGVGWQLGQVPVDSLGEQAIQAALDGRGPRPLPPGEYAVILSPYAVMDMISALDTHGINGLAVYEGRSWMAGRQGQAAVSPLISLWDDALDPAGVPLPFDGEGQPRQRVDVIRQGVIGEAVYDRATGKKAGQPSNGHALPPGQRSQGALACNLFLASGEAEDRDLLALAGKGALLVTRFWYTRLVKARDCTMTGMTRDGLFWVADGEVKYPVNNLRFTQSYLQALADVIAVGRKDCLLRGQYAELYARVPALMISRFRFTS